MSGGLWVFVTGPSGAGKDSLLGWARQALRDNPRIVFSRRVVTREAAGDPQEAVSPAAFDRLRAGGRLAWHWTANGFDYGIAHQHADDVAAGRIVVVNGSREHAMALSDRADVRVVLVTADPDLLVARLHARGREAEAAIRGRLARNAALGSLTADFVIANDGELAEAGRRLQAYLQALES